MKRNRARRNIEYEVAATLNPLTETLAESRSETRSETLSSAAVTGATLEPRRRVGLAERLEVAIGLSLRGQALVVAIAASVAVVTLVQLQAFAVQENQRDAIALVGRLGPALAAARAEAFGGPRAPDLAAAVPAEGLGLRGLSALSAVRLDRLGDVDWLEDGRRMRRHGYLFSLRGDADGRMWLAAWPWEHGRSGRNAYAWCSTRGLLAHPNRAGSLAGPGALPEPDDEGWARALRP